jgi:hypothetical protein
MFKNLMITAVFTCSATGHCMASSQIFDYEDVRRNGGFLSSRLSNVYNIIPAGDVLTPKEKRDLKKTQTLSNLKTLNLKDQNVDDEFIEAICQKPHFSRLQKIILSGNKDISDKSIDHILESPYIGRTRDLLQISGRYGYPANFIEVIADGTSVTDPEGRRCFEKVKFNFSMRYINAITGHRTSSSTDQAVKIVEVIL